jgi:hypothetical protein
MANVDTWSCPNCEVETESKFCSQCGEVRLEAIDLTFFGLLHKIAEVFFSIDGKLLRSFKALFLSPGKLTVLYTKGSRKRYTGPIQLFLISNVFFFAIQSLTNTNIFSSTLDSHLHHQDWSGLAQKLVAEKIERNGLTIDTYVSIFNSAAILNAKSLIILMTIPLSLLLPLIYFGVRKAFVTHVSFAIHFYAFLLIIFCISLFLSDINIYFGGAGLNSGTVDLVFTIMNLFLSAIYLYLSGRVVYGTSRIGGSIKALLLTAAVGSIVLGYRFSIFLFTLYST